MSDGIWDRLLETLPVDRRRALHEHRLQWQVRRCWEGSPFYRSWLENAGIDPAAFRGLDDLEKLPIVEAAALPTGRTAAPAATRVVPEAWTIATERGSGWPARALSDGDRIHQIDLAARALWAAGARPGQTLGLVGRWPTANLASLVGDGARRIGLRLPADGATTGGTAQRGTFTVRTDTVRTDLEAGRCEPPATIPAAGGQPLAPSLAWTNGAAAPRDDLADVSAVGRPFVGPILAYGCAARAGLHWADDHVLIEIVGADGHRVADGEAGAILLTDLTREGSPLLRFWTGLMGALDRAPCACGRTAPRTAQIWPGTATRN